MWNTTSRAFLGEMTHLWPLSGWTGFKTSQQLPYVHFLIMSSKNVQLSGNRLHFFTLNFRCKQVFVLPVRGGWVDYKLRVVFNKYNSSGQFLAILPASSMKYRFRQLFIIDTEGNSRTLLTKQEAEVTEVVEWTQDDQVYYISTLPGDPGARRLFLFYFIFSWYSKRLTEEAELFNDFLKYPKVLIIHSSFPL